MIAILSFACMISIGVTIMFVWGLCRAAGCADDRMAEITGQDYSG